MCTCLFEGGSFVHAACRPTQTPTPVQTKPNQTPFVTRQQPLKPRLAPTAVHGAAVAHTPLCALSPGLGAEITALRLTQWTPMPKGQYCTSAGHQCAATIAAPTTNQPTRTAARLASVTSARPDPTAVSQAASSSSSCFNKPSAAENQPTKCCPSPQPNPQASRAQAGTAAVTAATTGRLDTAAHSSCLLTATAAHRAYVHPAS